MNAFPIFGPGERRVTTLEEWAESAGPAGGKAQWKTGRSALELARRWVCGRIPEEVTAVLEENQHFAGFTAECAYAETKTALDDFPGNTRNQDLVVVGRTPARRAVLDVEGKADEAFDKTIAEKVQEARELLAEKPQSNLLARIEGLSRAIFGVEPDAIGMLRYQLLYGTAAALIRAGDEGASLAAFLVHEFRSTATRAERLKRNAGDLAVFIRRLGGDPLPLRTGDGLIGPLRVPGGGRVPGDVALFIGKAVAYVEAPSE